MSKTVIKAENIGKSFMLRHQTKNVRGQRMIREDVKEAARNFFRRGAAGGSREMETFWALKDVSFDIKEGESVGFIGHNGAGKSTLLKLLSRITEPTTGEIEITGRLASLLEVSTGFHPELTGRENIFLKGAISGMKRAEIKAKFDEIVDFAEIDRFLDTPVKQYSSGMYVKLGFAVAAHLDPEILIVDEALAVGDAQFQKKCIDKMQSIVTGQGRTLLFVSHNLNLIQSLCTRAILLWKGSLIKDGPNREVVDSYMQMADQVSTQDLATRKDRTGLGGVRLTGIEVCSGGEKRAKLLTTGQPAQIFLHLNRLESATSCAVLITTPSGMLLSRLESGFASSEDRVDQTLEKTLVCNLDELPLADGKYRISVVIRVGDKVHDSIQNACTFEVEKGTFKERSLSPMASGSVLIPHRWTTPAGAQA